MTKYAISVNDSDKDSIITKKIILNYEENDTEKDEGHSHKKGILDKEIQFKKLNMMPSFDVEALGQQ